MKDLQLFKTLIDQANVALYIVDPITSKILDFNDTACKTLGYTDRELLNMKVPDICLNITDHFTWDTNVNAVKEKGHLILEGGQRRKDGSSFPIELDIKYVPYKNKDYLVVVARDITERKKIEELANIKQTAIEKSINGFAFADLKGHLTYVNTSFLSLWGYDDKREVIGKPAIKFWQVEKEAQRIVKILLEKGSWIGEMTARKKDGSFFDALLVASIVADDVYKPVCLMGSFIDITDRKRAEKELRDKAKSLAEANAALKVLLKQGESDKTILEDRVLSNVKTLVSPYIEKLRKTKLESNALNFLNLLESNLKKIISEFPVKLSSKYFGLTPREIQIANLIREGKQSKDISRMLNLSFETIHCHRRSIRKKLGLRKRKTNMRSYLLSLSD